MALRKKDMISNISDKMGFPTKAATETVEQLMEIIKSTLASGEDVLISEFGKFCVKNRAQRKGRNPATGEAMMLSGRNVVTFKNSGKLLARLNGNKQ